MIPKIIRICLISTATRSICLITHCVSVYVPVVFVLIRSATHLLITTVVWHARWQLQIR